MLNYQKLKKRLKKCALVAIGLSIPFGGTYNMDCPKTWIIPM